MSGLSDQLKGVTPGPPPVEPEPDVEPVADGEGDGRTIDNVRGELLRKQEKDKAEIMGALAQLSQAIHSRPEPTPPPSAPSVNKTLDQMTFAELTALEATVDWTTVDEAQKSGFQAAKQARLVEEAVDSKLGSFTAQQQREDKRRRFNQEAVDLYPDLNNPGSEMAVAVDALLKDLNPAAVENNPRILLDVANSAAISQGVKPEVRREVHGLTRPASTRTAPAEKVEEDDPPGMMTDEQRAELARKFKAKGALPPGKDFDLDELKDSEKEVRKNIGMYTGSKLRGN